MLSDVPLSHGNARNIEAVHGALARGVRVWVLEGLLEQDRAGAAVSLRGTAARFVADETALLAALDEALRQSGA